MIQVPFGPAEWQSIAPFSGMGSVVQIIKAFGDKKGFEKAVHELQDALYLESA